MAKVQDNQELRMPYYVNAGILGADAGAMEKIKSREGLLLSLR